MVDYDNSKPLVNFELYNFRKAKICQSAFFPLKISNPGVKVQSVGLSVLWLYLPSLVRARFLHACLGLKAGGGETGDKAKLATDKGRQLE